MGSCDFCQAKSADCANGNLAGSTSCEDAKKRYHEFHGADHRKQEMARLIQGGMTGLTHKRYNVEDALKGMTLDALHEIWRFIRDAEVESDLRAKKATRQPWRKP